MRSPSSRPRLRAGLAVGALALAAGATSLAIPASAATAAASKSPTHVLIKSAAATSSGLADGAIKHVWLIIEENKSYDATFTGLNKNSYLWQTLPSQGVLLKNYYGTGHFSQDNYESLVSGQAPEQDTQSDCDVAATNFSSNALTSFTGSNASNVNYGQSVSAAGPNAKDGKNGCVYPTAAPTLFNQLDAAGKTWKGYGQDIGDQAGRDDGPCAYPGTTTNTPDATVDPGAPAGATTTTPTHSDSTALNTPKAYPGVQSFTGVQAAGKDSAGNASAEDGYVAKHFPFPWFHSLTDGNVTTPVGGGTDCDNTHIANLDGPPSSTSKYQGTSLVQDLQSEATTPNFSWITPNNCSDAHDSVCKGNNLSGAFNADGSPNYQTGGIKPFDPQGKTPANFTGGLYASDLFLKWYVPLIEQSPAFKDGGLIDVTFDEGNAPFANSSFNNANDPSFAANEANPPANDIPAGAQNLLQTALATDNAGQNINGTNVNTEPTGPNTPFAQNAVGSTSPTDANSTCPSTQAATLPCPGPGDNGFIDRTPAGPRNDAAATAASGTPTIADNGILYFDAGRTVACPAAQTAACGIPANAFVGTPSDTGPDFTNRNSATVGSFTLVDANGNALNTTAPVSGVALGGRTAATDPIYDATDQTPGGGDTGSVLISPFIKPGSISTTFYNHYSWLRTMEDIFGVSTGTATSPLTSGTTASISGGLDAAGHLGYAAQTGLAAFGADVFNNPAGDTPTPAPPASLPEAAWAVGLPIVALMMGGGLLMLRRRRINGSVA